MVPDTTGTLGLTQFDQFFFNLFSITGSGADTVGFGGFRMFKPGMAPDFDDVAYTLDVGPIDASQNGKTLCLDSSFYPPSGTWKWAGSVSDIFPAWDGPHCYTIGAPILPPEIVSIAPVTGARNTILSATITGANTFFTQGSPTTVWLDGPSTIMGYNVYASSETVLTADFDITCDDPIGLYSVHADFGGEAVTPLVDGFEVTLGDCGCELVYFTEFVETGNSYQFVNYNPPSCGIESGDEIGLFDMEQGLLVGAMAYCGETFPFNVVAWEEDSGHGLPGYISGNTLEILLYDQSGDSVICTELTGVLEFDGDIFGSIETITCVPCLTEFDLTIEANKWRLISFPVHPLFADGVDISCDDQAVFGGVPDLQIVQDDQGNAAFPTVPLWNLWTEGGVCQDYGEGYELFKYGDNYTLTVFGDEIAPDPVLIQASRWNFLGYPMLCEYSIEGVFVDMTSDVDIVQDDDGGVYIPAIGLNTIGNMIPGKGYSIFLSNMSDQYLQYPDCAVAVSSDERTEVAKTNARTTHYNFTETGRPFTVVFRNIGDDIEMGAEIGIFDGDLCVGGAVYQQEEVLAVSAWKGDAEHSLPGYTAGNKLTIKVQNSDGSEWTMPNPSTSDRCFESAPYLVVNVGKSSSIPKAFGLSQNYPNPFNPSTAINFALPQTSNVRLDIFNILGQHVITLADGEYAAGTHEVIWNGTNSNGGSVSSGIYLYRVKAGDNVHTKKMMLTK